MGLFMKRGPFITVEILSILSLTKLYLGSNLREDSGGKAGVY
jgi:hypothetical protein